MRRSRWLLTLIALAALLVVAPACGGGGDNAKKHEGEAAAAAAAYFVQEAEGARLPEGVEVRSVGASNIVTLEVNSSQKKESVKFRYCVEYQYQDRTENFAPHTRVYIAQLVKGEWSVESVKPDGNCSGVS